MAMGGNIPINEEIAEISPYIHHSKIASTEQPICTICDDDGISKTAVTWCTECEVFFCGKCEKPHRKSRLSKDHKTMSAEDYHQLPTFIKEISSQCKEHQEKFERYCSFHACLCCVQCITDKHQKCQDIKPRSVILNQVKSSASVPLFEKDLKNLKRNLDKALKYMKKRISANNTKKTEAVDEIRHMRKLIDDFLNELEQKILDDLESKHSKLKSEMVILVQQMEQRAVQINQLQVEFTKMTQYATDLQMYVGLKEIEKATSEVTKYIEDLKRGGQFDENSIEVTISSDLHSILQDVKSFGYINIHTTPSTFYVKAGRKDQAQHMLESNTDIQQIMPSLFRTLTIPKDMNSLSIRACVALPECKIIILDYSQFQLLLFSENGIFIRKVISFTAGPWDACYVAKNTVAVTLGNANQTAIVDVEKGTIIQTITLSHYCNGVASDGKTLVISSNHDQTTSVNLKDMSRTILKEVRASSISLFQGNIYVSIFRGNEISCYKRTGNLLWTFIHDDLSFPRGLALDKDGFIYIACKEENCIVVVSPDGKTCKTILSEADGILDPYAIDINRETGMMLVSSENNLCETVYVYKI